ncbi:ABC transporter substrate-binding protein [Sneathiella litorea]|uniref:Nitrate ABC transporter substrate-binding protein n=1 Tax=Sneathiella litorea TaxID=2606216 RepID=A0A6L8WC95_9PROT|nr:ABC transporter substrate-binding protein [Sneathiella litorea]MZR32319.1 nitrate ABC transporter substrate-binding protein [Sneathiella litorea]
MKKLVGAMLAGVAMLGLSAATSFAEEVNLILNWTPGADHAPIYYALDQGWYADEGIDLQVNSGKGSGLAAQTVGIGSSELGIAELGTAFVAKSKGADLTAIMVLYANSPLTLYWKKSSGINDPKDFAGRTLGNPPGDAARVLWPAFAKAVGLEDGAVSFVNLAPPAKNPSLAADRVDIISDFYNGHDAKINAFGDDLGFLRWSDFGINPYGNSFIVNTAFMKENPEIVGKFVAVTQRAFHACVENPDPCVKSLMDVASGLDKVAMDDQWKRVKELMADETTTTEGLGVFSGDRIQKTYDLIETYFGVEKPFDPASSYTNEYLDKNIKMTAQ